ncbi:MAG: hypothetical protein GTO40_05435 [Deltaproteobacteria bacterium]|nr:hypothetical protein [Deltaproteobacteria bacterium]
MIKVIVPLVMVFMFVLGGCSTFQGLKQDAKLAASKVKGMFSKGDEFTPSQMQVRKAQQMLASEGYPAGRPDGIMGPQTIGALKRYQSAHGLTVTGRVDKATLNSLGGD